jgi:hypothetical protein
MQATFHVIRDGRRWALEVDGERLALARTRRAAETLAREACEILRASGAAADVEIAREPRSFELRD